MRLSLARSLRSALLPVTLLMAAPLPVMAAELSSAQQQEVRDLVRKTLIEQPEILAEAMSVLRERSQQKELEAASAAIKAHHADLYEAAADPVLGNPKGSVTLVEFQDYRCGYCKAVFPQVTDLVEKDGNIRLIVKELPVLGPESVEAARWALAAKAQGKYNAFHTALMKYKGPLGSEVLKKVGRDSGLDLDKAARDAASDATSSQLKGNMALAEALGINGTPAFVIGDTLVPGAVDRETLAQLVKAARAGNAAHP